MQAQIRFTIKRLHNGLNFKLSYSLKNTHIAFVDVSKYKLLDIN